MATFLIVLLAFAQSPVPTIAIDRDNIDITQSCRVQVAGSPIIDADGNGVIQIKGDNLTIDFADQSLHGAPPQQLPDSFAGTGIAITGRNITLHNAKVSGYKVGIHAVEANGLTIHHCNISNNFHQRLKSTPKAEDGADWLFPHNNDNHEWITNYGAGLCVENSSDVTIHDIRARKGQNGIILDRVNDSKVYDCDCSFLSGWGLAMWRSNRNVISRSAFDFCIRGYSHGVYNRGQDSAGILMFEQCCDNVIAENSATHCGDGFFGFAGREALGEVNRNDDPTWYKVRGCNANVLLANALSYAAAHGIEMTFSFNNYFAENQLVGNAICGIWGGYSRDTAIVQNIIESNGDMAYGLERGGINIEHGQRNHMFKNEIANNRCGIHLWSNDNATFAASPWGTANSIGSTDEIIHRNTFEANDLDLQLRMSLRAQILFNGRPTVDSDAASKQSWKYPDGGTGTNAEPPDRASAARARITGKNSPVGARAALHGREHIIMTEWGPYDWESPLLQFEDRFDHADRYRLLGGKPLPPVEQIRVDGDVLIDVHHDRIIVSPRAMDTLVPYSIACDIDGQRVSAKGLLTGGSWTVKTFAWAVDPREDADRWRRQGLANVKSEVSCDPLNLPFGSGGMTEARGLPIVLPRDHFGTISTRTLTFPKGKWRIKTVSDDGIRVWMDDNVVIDDWTWHAPTPHDYEFAVDEPRAINLRVEHFELDGYAILNVDIEQVE